MEKAFLPFCSQHQFWTSNEFGGPWMYSYSYKKQMTLSVGHHTEADFALLHWEEAAGVEMEGAILTRSSIAPTSCALSVTRIIGRSE